MKKYANGITGKKVTGQYGDFYNISINIDVLKQYANEKGYVNLTMSSRKETGKYGETETFSINEFVPKVKNDKKQEKDENNPFNAINNYDDELPF